MVKNSEKGPYIKQRGNECLEKVPDEFGFDVDSCVVK